MWYRTRTGIKGALIAAWLAASMTMGAMSGHAAGSDAKTQSDYEKAQDVFAEYCLLVPRRDLRGVPLDPKLTEKQADQYRTDSYNDTEKKLATMRQKLMKLDHAAVEKMLHAQMLVQNPDDTDNLMCALEIVARSFPKKFETYQKMLKPDVDQSGFADYIRDTFLGKDMALHEDPYPGLK